MVILTQYRPATNTRGSRISAHAPGMGTGRVYIPFDHALNSTERHAQAARALIAKYPGLMQSLSAREFGELRVESIPNGYAFMRQCGETVNLGG